MTTAIHESIVVNMRYRSLSCAEPYDTQYHPYGMVFFDGDLYCIGFMVRYNEIRTLKIARIVSAELTKEHFRRPKDFSLCVHTQGTLGIFSHPGTPQKIKIRMDGWAASSIREAQRHPSQKILKDDGNNVIVQFELVDTTELKRWILSFGAHAQVLAPKSLAQEMTQDIKLMLTKYP